MLISELIVYPEDSEHSLNGCGMVIINAPWKFDQTANELVFNIGHTIQASI